MSKLGVTLSGDKATFRVWAPFAAAVAVQGDFSGWTEVAMTVDNHGVWSVKVDKVRGGQTIIS